MAQSEREKRIKEMRARRAERGTADPLNRLSAHIERSIADGNPVIHEIPPTKTVFLPLPELFSER